MCPMLPVQGEFISTMDIIIKYLKMVLKKYLDMTHNKNDSKRQLDCISRRNWLNIESASETIIHWEKGTI